MAIVQGIALGLAVGIPLWVLGRLLIQSLGKAEDSYDKSNVITTTG